MYFRHAKCVDDNPNKGRNQVPFFFFFSDCSQSKARTIPMHFECVIKGTESLIQILTRTSRYDVFQIFHRKCHFPFRKKWQPSPSVWTPASQQQSYSDSPCPSATSSPSTPAVFRFSSSVNAPSEMSSFLIDTNQGKKKKKVVACASLRSKTQPGGGYHDVFGFGRKRESSEAEVPQDVWRNHGNRTAGIICRAKR